jgi:BirA family biotin operon repressor/biotin-[acetyl-CoA-carboxylase] ligase
MGVRWVQLDRVSSTNEYLAGLLKRGEEREELVVVADYQETGKGQGNNRWHSDPGMNLLMSVLFFPVFLSAPRQFYLSKAVSLALCDLLHRNGTSPRIKWPNDIMAGKGKIAGVLIEHSVLRQHLAHSIVGIGLNLNQTDFPGFDVPATSLVLETGHTASPGKIAGELYACLHERMERLRQGAYDDTDREYLDLLYRIHKTSRFISGERSFQGVIRGVDAYGRLLVEEEGITRTYGFREINLTGY